MTDNQNGRIGHRPRHLSYLAHRRLIGILGFFLPVLLYVFAGLFHTEGLERWVLLDSVSAYYYTGAGGIFIGVLFALSLFLYTYPGYERFKADRRVGALGGTAALGVALCPTAAPDPLPSLSWWSKTIGVIHLVSAVLLFVAFILFSIWLFRKSRHRKRRDRSKEKRRRDDTCLICGLVMIICVIWAASSLITDAEIFLPEAIAIVAFAISWLTKGKAYRPVMRTIRRFIPVTGRK